MSPPPAHLSPVKYYGRRSKPPACTFSRQCFPKWVGDGRKAIVTKQDIACDKNGMITTDITNLSNGDRGVPTHTSNMIHIVFIYI